MSWLRSSSSLVVVEEVGYPVVVLTVVWMLDHWVGCCVVDPCFVPIVVGSQHVVHAGSPCHQVVPDALCLCSQVVPDVVADVLLSVKRSHDQVADLLFLVVVPQVFGLVLLLPLPWR